MNHVALVGNITDDPELRYTQSGAALANFTVAVSYRSKHNGEWQDINDGFFRCTAWRSVAENASRTLHKGDRVMVIGKLIQRAFEVEGQSGRPWRCRFSTSGPEHGDSLEDGSVGMRLFVAGKLVQRTFEVEGNKRTVVDIQSPTWDRTSSSQPQR